MCDVIGCTSAISEHFWQRGRNYCFEHAPLHCRGVFKDGTKCQSENLKKMYEDRKHKRRAYLCGVCGFTTVLPL